MAERNALQRSWMVIPSTCTSKVENSKFVTEHSNHRVRDQAGFFGEAPISLATLLHAVRGFSLGVIRRLDYKWVDI